MRLIKIAGKPNEQQIQCLRSSLSLLFPVTFLFMCSVLHVMRYILLLVKVTFTVTPLYILYCFMSGKMFTILSAASWLGCRVTEIELSSLNPEAGGDLVGSDPPLLGLQLPESEAGPAR